jgi:hypothetical protein
MMTRDAALTLKRFLAEPNPITASTLVEIPTIHALLSNEISVHNTVSASILHVCHWILERAQKVFGLLVGGIVELPLMGLGAEKPWEEVSGSVDKSGDY